MDKHDHNANNQEHSHATAGQRPAGLAERQAFLYQTALDALEHAQSIFAQLSHELGLPEPDGSCSSSNPEPFCKPREASGVPASVDLPPKAAPSQHPGTFTPDEMAAAMRAMLCNGIDVSEYLKKNEPPTARPQAAARDNAEAPLAPCGTIFYHQGGNWMARLLRRFSTTDEHGCTRIRSVRGNLFATKNTKTGRCPHKETHGEM